MPVTPATRSSPEKPRPRNARGEGDRLRTDLLDAAADLLAEHGNIEGVSLRAIASRAGVSPTAVYRHFEDHADLMLSAINYCWAELHRVLLEASDDPDPFVRFHLMGEAYTDFAMNERGKYQVIFALMHTNGADKNDMGLATFAVLVDVVAEMLTANNDSRDPFLVSSLVHSWMHGIVGLCDPDPNAESPWPKVPAMMAELKNYLWLNPAGGTS